MRWILNEDDLGDEIIRINDVSMENDNIEMTVTRGIWGTKAASHAVDTLVLQPVYIGSVVGHADTALSGVPDSKASLKGLRYACSQDSPEFWEWLGDKCEGIFKRGYDVAWLDVTSSNASRTTSSSLTTSGRLLFGGQWKGPAGQPEEIFYYDLGTPTQQFTKAGEASDPEVKGLYRREYTKALILANPTDKLLKRSLDTPMFDTDTDSLVEQVQIEPRCAKILLKQSSAETE